MANKDFEAKDFFSFFFSDGWFWSGRSLVMWVSCASTAGTIIFSPTLCPVTVGDVFLANELDMVAHTGSITLQSWWPWHHCLLRWKHSLMRELTDWDQYVFFRIKTIVLLLCVCLVSNPNLFKPSHSSYGSWFHINDNKIPLHRCLRKYYILFLDKMSFWISEFLSIQTLRDTQWHWSVNSWSRVLCLSILFVSQLVYFSSFHFSPQLFHSLLGNTDKNSKKCMLLGHLIDHWPLNSILSLQVALAPRQAGLFNLFMSLSPCTQVTMFKQAESWFKAHNDISCRPSSPK